MWHWFSWRSHVTPISHIVTNRLGSVAVWSKFTPNSMTIPCHLPRFYLFSMLEHDMDFGEKVQVTEFPRHLPRTWWDFPCGFGLTFEPDQTAVQKTWENIKCHIFYRVRITLEMWNVKVRLSRGNYLNHEHNSGKWSGNVKKSVQFSQTSLFP